MRDVLFHECDGPTSFYRASGNVICDVCNQPYYKHHYCSNSKIPEDMNASSWPMYYLHVLCNGEHVKL